LKHFLLILLLATAAHGQTQARICWEMKTGGIHWCSEPYSLKTAEAWVELSNRNWANSIFAYTEILPDELPFSDHLRLDAIDSQPLAPLWTALGQESKLPKPHPGDEMVKMLEQQEACKISVFVGERKSVTVTIPCMARDDEIEVISTFFGRGDEAAKKRFESVLKDAGEITLTITSKHKFSTK
jgi:hypothetical protein